MGFTHDTLAQRVVLGSGNAARAVVWSATDPTAPGRVGDPVWDAACDAMTKVTQPLGDFVDLAYDATTCRAVTAA